MALANGALLKQETNGNMETFYWKLDKPCPSYLICLAVGEFDVVKDSPGQILDSSTIPIQYYAPKGLYPLADIRRAFDQTPSMIQWIQKKLNVKFPWPKYFQVAAPVYCFLKIGCSRSDGEY